MKIKQLWKTFKRSPGQSARKTHKSNFTGAGTSQYVGDTVVPYLRAHGDTQAFSFESIGTTDIVAKPEDYLIKDEPTLLVSFARSGNSPESLAAVEVANQVVETIHHLAITCAEEGQLAQISQKKKTAFILNANTFQ